MQFRLRSEFCVCVIQYAAASEASSAEHENAKAFEGYGSA